MSHSAPVFIDTSGRRWRRIRRAALVLGAVTTVAALGFTATLLFWTPTLPALKPASMVPVNPLKSGAQRERLNLRRKLMLAVARYGKPAPARRPSAVPVVASGPTTPHAAPPRGEPIVAGFLVNWEDNSYASLDRNMKHLDWVLLEWAFVGSHGDSLRLDTASVGRKIFDRLQKEPRNTRPKLFAMVSNFDTTAGGDFRSGPLVSLLTRPETRARAIAQLRDLVVHDSLAGVLVDFEVNQNTKSGVDVHALALQFTRELRAALAPLGRQTMVAVPAYETDEQLRDIVGVSDYVFGMIFDEHYSAGDPGPIASQSFYEAQARRMASVVPPSKLILMIGAYGYDWNDQPPEGKLPKQAETMAFQDVVTAVRDSGGTLHMDPVSLNPFVTYTSPDSTDHVVWFLDALTAYNEMKVAASVGAAGSAIWRLGGEDPALWNALRPDGTLDSPDQLRVMPPGYYAELEGNGEILSVRAEPSSGRRTVRVDRARGLVVDEEWATFPTPYIVQRYGLHIVHPHWVALTFDDGPDGTWTPQILDTLASRGVKATFFVIGQNADAHTRLLRRIYAEGHEIGNHTYSHPNLALTSSFMTRFELDANQRLIESLLGRGTALFRPPYFGDAEPTTDNELVPVSLASRRGYLTAGLHVDSDDWKMPPVDTIIANVLAARPSVDNPDATCRDTLGRKDTRACNVVLLHDAGGDRSRTVAAIGPLIDSLRAHGDTLVLVSQLIGKTRDEVMPALSASGRMWAFSRLLTRGVFQSLGIAELTLFWVFTTAVVLGIARLFFIGALAIVQRVKSHQDREAPPSTAFAPPVTVLVPAYNEEKVIARTIDTLLHQDYTGAIEVIVVDDGSRDGTYAAAMSSFGHDPRVQVHAKPNGGKASALNFGLERAHHEIVIGLDADTLFADDTIRELVQPLADQRVGAVAGNAKVGNRINMVTRWQALEYVTSQNLDRRAFSLLDCITVVPGAVGAWRRSVVREVGGFRDDTLAEDQDLTLAVRRAGYSVGYADGAVAYTEAPDTLRGLAKQRFRWSFGTLQCAWKHRDVMFRRRYGTLGWVALPNVWLFQLLLPAISPIADLMFLWSLVSVWLTWQEHGGSYALVNLIQVLTYYAVFLLVDWLAAVIAFLMEPGEERGLTWLIFLQRFAYRQVMYWVVVRSFVAAVRGRVVGWGKLERKATVAVRA